MSDANLKPVLFISYFYPPLKTVGTKRVEQFVRHLPQYGYQPYILTTSRFGVMPNDEDKKIFRTQELESIFLNFFRKSKKKKMS